MIAKTLFVTMALLLALGFWLMGELKFFIPYKLALWREYAIPILSYVALVSRQRLCYRLRFIRNLFLKDTGRKLSNLDKQLHRDRGARALV